jgi:hypothetical protein
MSRELSRLAIAISVSSAALECPEKRKPEKVINSQANELLTSR